MIYSLRHIEWIKVWKPLQISGNPWTWSGKREKPDITTLWNFNPPQSSVDPPSAQAKVQRYPSYKSYLTFQTCIITVTTLTLKIWNTALSSQIWTLCLVLDRIFFKSQTEAALLWRWYFLDATIWSWNQAKNSKHLYFDWDFVFVVKALCLDWRKQLETFAAAWSSSLLVAASVKKTLNWIKQVGDVATSFACFHVFISW